MGFSYDPTLPNPPHTPAQDVSGMQTNAGSINNIWAVDHYQFGASTPGQHMQCTFPNFISAPSAPENPLSYLFTYNDSATGISQLQFLNSKNGNQYTGALNGSTTLFGGIIIKWGRNTIQSGMNSKNFNFVTAFPTGCYVVLATPNTTAPGSGQFLATNGLSTSGVTVYCGSSTGIDFFWIAIGN